MSEGVSEGVGGGGKDRKRESGSGGTAGVDTRVALSTHVLHHLSRHPLPRDLSRRNLV